MAELNRDFKGVWIPKEIWLNEELSILEKCVLVEIDSLNGENGCFASNKYLADFCKCSESAVEKSIRKLKDLGFIYVESFDGRTRVLRSRVVKFTVQNSKTYDSESESLRPNNIDYKNRRDIKEYDISSLHSDISNKKDEPSLDTIDLPEVNPDKDRTGKDSIGNDTDKPSIPKVPYEKIKDLYNSICTSLPKCTLVSEKRKTSIKAVTSKFQTDQIEEAFRKAEASDFLTGRSKTGWSGCSFDWLMNTNNMLKVLEGNYDNRGKHEFTEDDFVLE